MITFIRLPLLVNTMSDYKDFDTDHEAALKKLGRELDRGAEIISEERVEAKSGAQICYVLHRARKPKAQTTN